MRHALKLLAVLGLLAVALASPGNAQQFGGTTYCNSQVIFDATPSGAATRLIASRETGSIYVCGYTFSSPATVAVSLIAGTGVTCGTGTFTITPAYQFRASTVGIAAVNDHPSNYAGINVPAGNDLCINVSPVSQSVQAVVYFYQQR